MSSRPSLFCSSPTPPASQRPARNPSYILPVPVASRQNSSNGAGQPRHNPPYSNSIQWLDPFAPQQPPQEQQLPPPSAPGRPQYEDDPFDRDLFTSTPDLGHLDWESLERDIHSNYHHNNSESRAAESSAAMPPSTRKRSRDSPRTEAERHSKRAREDGGEEGAKRQVEELDLLDVEDDSGYAAAMRKRQQDLEKQKREEELNQPAKLATTQCVICLDQPEDLAITHCGHMFCSLCLHGALNANAGKRTCPVCRTPVGMKKKDGKQPRNGVFHLEMKVRSKKQGKQPAKS